MILENKVALITGSGRGIGLEIARKFYSQGAAVMLSDISSDLLQQAQGGFAESEKVAAVVCDVSVAESVDRLIDSTLERFGRLDILINNAGITRDGLLVRLKEEDWDLVLRVNLKGAFLVSQAAAKTMIRQRAGRIINIASVVGVMGNAGQANYSASKAGLIGLTKSCAKELAGRNITVNAIAPGYITTAMTTGLPEKAIEAFLGMIPLNRAGSAEDVANLAMFLASDWAGYITGQVIHVDGGMLM